MPFIAVGHKGSRLLSQDGVKWELTATGKDGEVYRAAAASPSRLVTVGTFGGRNILASSADGRAWTNDSRDGQYKYRLLGLTFGNKTFLAFGGDPGSVGSSSPFVLLSEDGQKWSDQIPISGKHILRRMAWGNDRFVAVGDRGRRATSKDGKLWEDVPNPKATDTLTDIAFGNGLFVGVGLHGLRMSTKDGLQWSPRIPGEEGEHLNTILFADGRFVAIGEGATYTSPDGQTWARIPNQKAPQTAIFANGLFLGAAYKGRLLHSKDGLAWTESHKHDEHLEAVAFIPPAAP